MIPSASTKAAAAPGPSWNVADAAAPKPTGDTVGFTFAATIQREASPRHFTSRLRSGTRYGAAAIARTMTAAVQRERLRRDNGRATQHQLSLALRLGFMREDEHRPVADLAAQTAKTLNGLIRALRKACPGA
jgi:hypothetical protein